MNISTHLMARPSTTKLSHQVSYIKGVTVDETRKCKQAYYEQVLISSLCDALSSSKCTLFLILLNR